MTPLSENSKVQPVARASRPGVQHVKDDEASRFDRRIADKQRNGGGRGKQMDEETKVDLDDNVCCASKPEATLSTHEADVDAKNRARSIMSTSFVPGAYQQRNATNNIDPAARKASSNRTTMDNLESDIDIKNRARSGVPSMVAPSVSDQDQRNKGDTNDEKSKYRSVSSSGPALIPGSISQAGNMQVTITSTDRSMAKQADGIRGCANVQSIPEITKEGAVMGKKDAVATKEMDIEAGKKKAEEAYGTSTEEGMSELAIAKAVTEDESEDGYIAAAIEFDPDSKPAMQKKRRIKMGVFILIVVIVVAVIASVIGTQVAKDNNEETVAPTTYRESLGIQAVIEKLIGDELLSNSSTPEYKALEWIINEDPMELDTESENLIQRYTLAAFYYSTSKYRPWRSCNPPTEGQNHTCQYQKMIKFREPYEFEPSPWVRWLSDQHECEWAGVVCENNQTVRFSMYGNDLNGPLPKVLKHLPFLSAFVFAFNNLTGTLPVELVELDHLTDIVVHKNLFSGTIPQEYFGFDALLRMNLGWNNFIGTLPTEVGLLTTLQGLFIFGTMMNGPIPSELGKLERLEYSRFQDNQFSGTIPSEVGLLTTLTELWFEQNEMEGPIPSEIGNIAGLRDLRLSSQEITGTIPDELYDLKTLFRFDCNGCKLSGTISTKIGKLESLNVLGLANNSIAGTLPKEIALLEDLSQTLINGNQLSGSIPSEFCELQMSNLSPEREIVADCLPSKNSPVIKCEPMGCCTKCCNDGHCLDMIAKNTTEN